MAGFRAAVAVFLRSLLMLLLRLLMMMAAVTVMTVPLA